MLSNFIRDAGFSEGKATLLQEVEESGSLSPLSSQGYPAQISVDTGNPDIFRVALDLGVLGSKIQHHQFLQRISKLLDLREFELECLKCGIDAMPIVRTYLGFSNSGSLKFYFTTLRASNMSRFAIALMPQNFRPSANHWAYITNRLARYEGFSIESDRTSFRNVNVYCRVRENIKRSVLLKHIDDDVAKSAKSVFEQIQIGSDAKVAGHCLLTGKINTSGQIGSSKIEIAAAKSYCLEKRSEFMPIFCLGEKLGNEKKSILEGISIRKKGADRSFIGYFSINSR
ncbi:MAG: hypothetical protein AAF936_12725 [Pseudomonadota bacterium]